jgi:hypothetical protein
VPRSRLSLVPRVRPARNGVPLRRWLDFVVDGRSMAELLDVGENIGCLGWWPVKAEAEHLERLKDRAPADLPSGRVSLYVCPVCGGLDCGAVTVRITREGDDLVWSDFAWEREADLDDYAPYPRGIPGVGPFRFDRAQYRRTLNARLLEL